MPKEPKALQLIKTKMSEEEAKEIEKYIEALEKKNVAVLNDDEVFVLATSEGKFRQFKGMACLSSDDGTLVKIKDKWSISAMGYERINEATGTTVVNAPTVIVDGVPQQNPFVLRDPVNNKIRAIYCRSIAYRITNRGNQIAQDRTSIFDIPSYRLIDLLAKAKATPQAFKLLPINQAPNTEAGTWARYDFDESTSLWIDTSHPEALKFYSEIINREKKAMDFAQTFAQRNAAKHLHGLQASPGNKPEMRITTYCWRSNDGNTLKWSLDGYFNTQKQLKKLTEQKTIELKQGTDYVTGEEVVAEVSENGETDAPEAGKRPQGESDAPKTQSREEPNSPTWKHLDATAKSVPEFFQSALDALGMKTNDIITIENASKVMAKANEIADAA